MPGPKTCAGSGWPRCFSPSARTRRKSMVARTSPSSSCARSGRSPMSARRGRRRRGAPALRIRDRSRGFRSRRRGVRTRNRRSRARAARGSRFRTAAANAASAPSRSREELRLDVGLARRACRSRPGGRRPPERRGRASTMRERVAEQPAEVRRREALGRRPSFASTASRRRSRARAPRRRSAGPRRIPPPRPGARAPRTRGPCAIGSLRHDLVERLAAERLALRVLEDARHRRARRARRPRPRRRPASGPASAAADPARPSRGTSSTLPGVPAVERREVAAVGVRHPDALRDEELAVRKSAGELSERGREAEDLVDPVDRRRRDPERRPRAVIAVVAVRDDRVQAVVAARELDEDEDGSALRRGSPPRARARPRGPRAARARARRARRAAGSPRRSIISAPLERADGRSATSRTSAPSRSRRRARSGSRRARLVGTRAEEGLARRRRRRRSALASSGRSEACASAPRRRTRAGSVRRASRSRG